MTTRLILVRHGNTFKPEEKPVWVGARSDLPLVEKGHLQAKAVADMLQKAKIVPDHFYTGPLQRTKQTAYIVAGALRVPQDKIHIDQRLTEIDYGKWEGKSNAEIEAMGDGEKLAAWTKSSVFPKTANWVPSEDQIINQTQALLGEISKGTSLVITSNGILRFFARAARNAKDFPDYKVLTGHISVMEYLKDGWHIVLWNEPPEQFLLKP